MKSSTNHVFEGVYPALVTPFDDDGAFSRSAMRDLVQYHQGKSVDGFYVCGSTGQGIALSMEERKAVIETVVDTVEGSAPVIVHIGAVAVSDAVCLAAHAQSVGVAGISSIIPPLYSNLEALKRYFTEIAEAASDTPVLPYLFGGLVKAFDLLNAVSDLPNLRGTKVTGPNMYELKQIIDMRPQPWAVFSGMDEQCAFAVMSGAHGNIGSSVNVIPGVYRSIRDKLKLGDTSAAMEMQHRGNGVINALQTFGYAGALRRAIGILGIPCGQPRLPGLPFAEGRLNELETLLDRVGFKELSSL